MRTLIPALLALAACTDDTTLPGEPDTVACDLQATDLQWDDPSVARIADFEGDHSATAAWSDGTSVGVTLHVARDADGLPRRLDPAPGADPSCRSSLEIPVLATLSTDDGALAEDYGGAWSFGADEADPAFGVAWSLAPSELQGTFDPASLALEAGEHVESIGISAWIDDVGLHADLSATVLGEDADTEWDRSEPVLATP